MESNAQNPAFARTTPKTRPRLLDHHCALLPEMSFTAYYELLPQGLQAFTRLVSPTATSASSFRWPSGGAAALLIPFFPARLREWAYAGFAINLVSAIIAHLSIRDIPLAFRPIDDHQRPVDISYYFWRRYRPQAYSERIWPGRPNAA